MALVEVTGVAVVAVAAHPEMAELDPPAQPALRNRPAPARCRTPLTGVVTVLPETIGMLKLPVVLPLSEAWATPAPGSASMAATSAGRP